MKRTRTHTSVGGQHARHTLHKHGMAMLVVLLALMLSSCVMLPSTNLKPAATPPIATIQPIQAPHQAYITIAVGLDISGSYPRFVFEQAKQGVADAIDRLIQPNMDGATVYVTWITDNSFSPNSTAIPPIVIPALPADPAMPTAIRTRMPRQQKW